MRRILKSAFIILLCTMVLIPATAYAWISFVFPFSNSDFSTGKLTPVLEAYAWDSEQWAQIISNEDGMATVYPKLGKIDNLAEIPDNLRTYIKIKVEDDSDVLYKWRVSVSKINIIAKDDNGNIIYSSETNYYNINNSCLGYAMYISSESLAPNEIAYGDKIKINDYNQNLTENFLSQESWLYLYIELSVYEFQNILRYIPISIVPYNLQFEMILEGEGITIDYE